MKPAASPREDTRGKFLSAIAVQVKLDAVIEAHVFPSIRQGEFESGVAVIAVEEEPHDESSDATGDNRLAVYTAKYRLTIKGPDRGHWEFDMHAEADAPLVTVDAVVRGVARRSGDGQEPERFTGEEFRALLPAPADEPAQDEHS